MGKKQSIKTGFAVLTILTIALTVFSFPELINCKDDVLAASDKEYAISVSGIGVNDENKDDILGQGNKEAVYDPESNTLELNGDINASYETGITSYIEDLTIKVNKDVKIDTYYKYSIFVEADTTITGPGKLILSAPNAEFTINYPFGELKIIDADIELTSGYMGISSGYHNEKPLYIENSYISASGKECAVGFVVKGIDLRCVKVAEPSDGKVCNQGEQLFYIGNADGYSLAKTVKLEPSHNWGKWTVTTKAQVGKKGVETRTCSDCGRSETRQIPALSPSATPTATPTSKPSVTLTLNKKNTSVVCGKTETLKATLKGSSSKITWKSSNTKIATVDSKGKVTAKMAGEVTITATAAGKSAKCTVTVLYKDVTNSKDFWYAPTNYLTAKGVVKGYDKQTKFKPANECTRAQMVTFIWRLQGEPNPKAATCKFKDVKKTDYFYKACIWGNENHIVEGYKDGTFGPQIVCARKHAVTFLWRLAGQPKPSSAKNKFKDVKEKDYFYKATLWAAEKKILAGYEDGTFRPNGECLRRQMVTFLYKYDKYINGKG